MPSIKCSSFDVFDTCLVRRVGSPTEVFRLIGHEIAKKTAQRRPAEFAEQFVEWRCEAERRVRKQTEREDIRLEEIWSELRRMMPALLIANKFGPDGEMAMEWSLLGPIEMTKACVNKARSLGRRIIFVSDMYLPQDFLKRALRHHGFLQAQDAVYVSGDIGLSKQTGSLFRHIIQCEKLAPEEIEHLGDHALSDFEVPSKLGIKAELFVMPDPPAVTNVLLRSRLAFDDSCIRTAAHLRYKRMMSAPPQSVGNESIKALVEGFLGPILCLFGYWTLNRAASEGIERLFFVSRDAQLAWVISKRLLQHTHKNIDIRYLYISRRAIYLPSATDISPDGMPWLRHSDDVCSLPRLLNKLELPQEDFIPRWMQIYPSWRLPMELTTCKQWEHFWEILRSAAFAPTLKHSIETNRTAALEYFDQAGVLDDIPSAVVDLGSLLYCQEALNRVCAERRTKHPISGYYLYLRRKRRGLAEAGQAEAIVYQTRAKAPNWFHRTAAIEHILGIANHPSVLGYEAGGKVKFVQTQRAIDTKYYESIERELIAYVDTYGECWRGLSEDKYLSVMISDLLNDFFDRPKPSYILALKEILVDAERLIEPFSLAEVVLNLLPSRLTRAIPFAKRTCRFWPEASLMATSQPQRWLQSNSRFGRMIYDRLLGRQLLL